MKDNLKYILGILVALIVLVVVGYFIFNKPSSVNHSTSNTKTVTTEEIKTTQNTFTIEQVSVIKKALTDSLEKVYGSIIKKLKAVNTPGEKDSTEYDGYSYFSEVDSQFVVKDDSGSVTDMLNVKSTFISSKLLPVTSVHLLKVNHTSFRKETKTDSKTSDTVYVKENKSFWERFVISPNVSAGYGLINKKFDVYTGVGLSFEFNALEIFSSNKK